MKGALAPAVRTSKAKAAVKSSARIAGLKACTTTIARARTHACPSPKPGENGWPPAWNSLALSSKPNQNNLSRMTDNLRQALSRRMLNESPFDISTFSVVADSWQKRFPPPEQVKVPQLSHYTTAEGLLGICRSNSLWATCAQYSNDLSEVEYAREIASALIRGQ